MRRLAFVLFVSCASQDPSPECVTDADCGDQVCARDGSCLPANEIRQVTVTWTIDGMAADAQTCVPSPDLFVQFDGPEFNQSVGFAPVPCSQGQFNVDKLPSSYQQVELGIDGRGVLDAQPINSTTNTADFDLVP